MSPLITVLDGGMGRELHRIGAPFRQPEWSALALMEGPDWVVKAHRNFIEAGARVVTTNSYACVPFHLGDEVFEARGRELAALAGTLARRAVAESGCADVRVAGSLPPVYGSYRPDLFDADHAGELVRVLVDALAPNVDLWLIETTGSIGEATCSLGVVASAPKPTWVSFTLVDQLRDGKAVLRSGESITSAIDACQDQVSAVLFNCSQPEVMGAALAEARSALPLSGEIQVGVYANAFPEVEPEREANEGLSDIRADLTPDRYASFAEEWAALGATIIGGCCGIRPDHIRAIADRLT